MRISYSALDTYQTCPLKYKFQAIDKIPTPKSKEAVFGTVIHSTMKFIHNPGILSPTLEQALDYFSRSWNSEVFENELEERAAFSQGIEMIQKYYSQNDVSKANIVALESNFQIPLDNHVISGIIDRIDRTEDGFEIIDYKTAKKMPSQEKVDHDIQLSVYLKAFLHRYPAEAKNIDKIKVSLYFLKHGVKLTASRTEEHLKASEQLFLDTIALIEGQNFEPKVSPLCDWCGYQKICPMWKHKFKELRKLDSAEINAIIEEYIRSKSQISNLKSQIAKLQEAISGYMDQEGVEQVFGQGAVIARSIRKSYKYDAAILKSILEPLDKWEEVLKVDGVALNKIIGALPFETKKAVEKAKTVDKETKSLSLKKTAIEDSDE